MIQRIQTVYLVLGALVWLALFLFGRLWNDPAVETLPWLAPLVLIGGGIVALGALGAVFLYKNRAQQQRVVLLLQVLTLLLLAVLYVGVFFLTSFSLYTEGALDVWKTVALFMPAVAYLLFMLARRGIQRDIALLRSVDRLR